MTEYFAQVIEELADNNVLNVGETVESCCEEISGNGFVA